MSQRLKRWESPRREGRNDKGRGGSARQRQKQKQMKALRQRLKSDESKPLEKPPKGDRAKPQKSPGREIKSLPFFCPVSSGLRQLSYQLRFSQGKEGGRSGFFSLVGGRSLLHAHQIVPQQH